MKRIVLASARVMALASFMGGCSYLAGYSDELADGASDGGRADARAKLPARDGALGPEEGDGTDAAATDASETDAATGDALLTDAGTDGMVAPKPCEPIAAQKASGKHNAGKDCIRCHDGKDDEAPLFSVGGTVYGSNGKGREGVTVIVQDAAGMMLKLISAENGNFWSETKLTYPLKVAATACPDRLDMIAPVASPGDCNAGGCHDTNRRLRIPR